MDAAQPVEQLPIVEQRPRPETAGDDDDVGAGHLVQPCVTEQPEHPVVAAHLATSVADENHLQLRYAAQYLVGSDRIQCGESGKQWNRDLHPASSHRPSASTGIIVGPEFPDRPGKTAVFLPEKCTRISSVGMR